MDQEVHEATAPDEKDANQPPADTLPGRSVSPAGPVLLRL